MDQTGVADWVASPEAALVVSRAGTVLQVNAAALELLGYARDEIVGCALDWLLPERLREAHRAHLGRYFLNPRPRHLPLGLSTVASVSLHARGVTSDAGLRSRAGADPARLDPNRLRRSAFGRPGASRQSRARGLLPRGRRPREAGSKHDPWSA